MFKRLLLVLVLGVIVVAAAPLIVKSTSQTSISTPQSIEDVYNTPATCTQTALDAARDEYQRAGKTTGDSGPYVRAELWLAKVDYECGRKAVAGNNWPTARIFFEDGIKLEQGAVLMSSWDQPGPGCRFARKFLPTYGVTGAIALKMKDQQFYQFAQDGYQKMAAWIAGECS